MWLAINGASGDNLCDKLITPITFVELELVLSRTAMQCLAQRFWSAEKNANLSLFSWMGYRQLFKNFVEIGSTIVCRGPETGDGVSCECFTLINSMGVNCTLIFFFPFCIELVRLALVICTQFT